MESYSIRVIHSDKLNFNTSTFLEKNELSISANGRMCHQQKGVCLDSKELAESYLNAIKIRRQQDGDTEFDAVITMWRSDNAKLAEIIKADSKHVREKLSNWKNSLKKKDVTTQSKPKWIVRIQIKEDEQTYFLSKMGRGTTFDITTDKTHAKRYTQFHFVQKALEKINQSQHFRAFSIEVD